MKPIDGRSRRPTEEEAQHIREVYDRTQSFAATVRITGIGLRVVNRIIRGEPTRAIGAHSKVTTPEIDAKIVADYRRLRTCTKVAALYGVVPETVRKIVRASGVARRSRDDMLQYPEPRNGH